MVNYRNNFFSNPLVCNGHTVFKGTRVPLRVVLDSLAEGASADEILKSYPSLTLGNVQTAIAYASDAARENEPFQAFTLRLNL
ncbi:MAG: DUF433 domain-containing protein [bacterium]